MLYDHAFAPGRGALSSYQLRQGVPPIAELCQLIRDDYDVVAAAIRYWPIKVGDNNNAAILLGPVAVHQTYQGEGLGALLITETTEMARKAGWQAIILVGDPPYYSRFGFISAAPYGIIFPQPVNPDRVLIKELSIDAAKQLKGPITTHELIN